MALNIKHIRFLNLFGFTHISGTIDIDGDIAALAKSGALNQNCEEDKTERLENKCKSEDIQNDKS